MNAQILSYLHDHLDDYLADLRTLTSVDSGTLLKPGVDWVQDWMQARLEELGFAVERLPQERLGDNLLGRRAGRGGKRVLLLGHADTVFPAGTAAARPMRIDGSKILGPGTCDMKAGLLTGLYALA
ncbi:MAG: M20/M25/M40 family metallo-hydrolase, partial [Caldilineaceae bacterium]|nr:M20/M25/M40 family metallo-hydrolase [Caldilineaceae bacterium]